MNDQNQRELIELDAPSGKKLKIKSYITARERNEIRAVMLPHMSVKLGENVINDQVTVDILAKAEPVLIKIIVAEYDGSSENVLDRILDGSPEDYDFIVGKLQAINNGNLNLAKSSTAGSDTSQANQELS